MRTPSQAKEKQCMHGHKWMEEKLTKFYPTQKLDGQNIALASERAKISTLGGAFPFPPLGGKWYACGVGGEIKEVAGLSLAAGQGVAAGRASTFGKYGPGPGPVAPKKSFIFLNAKSLCDLSWKNKLILVEEIPGVTTFFYYTIFS